MASLPQPTSDNTSDSLLLPVEEGSRHVPAPPDAGYTIVDCIKYPDEAFTAHRKAAPRSFEHERIDLRNLLQPNNIRDLRDDQYINCFVTHGEGFTAMEGCDSMTNAFTISTNVECFPTWRQPMDVLIPIRHTHKGWSENHFPHPPRPKGLPKGPEIRHLDIVKIWRGLSIAEATELITWEMSFRAVLATCLSNKLDFIEGYVIDIEHGLRGKDWPVFRRLPFNIVHLAEELVEHVRSQRGYRGLFESLGDIKKWAFQFICLHDCFTGGECAVDELLMGVKVLPYGMRNMGYQSPGSTVDIRWEPHYLSFDGTDWKCVEGHEFSLIPQYNCAPMGGTVISVEFTTLSKWLTWDESNQRFFGIMPFFSDHRTRQFFDDLTITCNNPGIYSYSILITVCGYATVCFGPNIRFEQAVRARITVDVLRRESPEVISRLPHEMELYISGRSSGRMFLPYFSVAPKGDSGDYISDNEKLNNQTRMKPARQDLPPPSPSEPIDDDDPFKVFGGTRALLSLSEEEACNLVLNTPMPPWREILAARRKRAQEAADPSFVIRRRKIFPSLISISRRDSSTSWSSWNQRRMEGTDSMSGGLTTRSNPSVHSQRSTLIISENNTANADNCQSLLQNSHHPSPSSSDRGLTPITSSDNDNNGYSVAPYNESTNASGSPASKNAETEALGREQCQDILNLLRNGPRSSQVKGSLSPPDEGSSTTVPRYNNIWKHHGDSVQQTQPQPEVTGPDSEKSQINTSTASTIGTPPETPPDTPQPQEITPQPDTPQTHGEMTMASEAQEADNPSDGLSPPPFQHQQSTTPSNDVDTEASGLLGSYYTWPISQNISDRLADQDNWVLEVPSCVQTSDRPPMDMEPFRDIMERMNADIDTLVPVPPYV